MERRDDVLLGGVRMIVRDASDLVACEAAVDVAVCGISLVDWDATRFRERGAHDPIPTHYFVLDRLFGYFSFSENSHLLDVGCGAGRVLAQFVKNGYPGKVTGVEIDPELAATVRSWTQRYRNASVVEGNVLDLDLARFTDFYLFNPFDSAVLQDFVLAVESQVKRPCTVVHMSDNGETWCYTGRRGWAKRASGEIQAFRNDEGCKVNVYDHPQHFTVWRYDGKGA